MAKGSDPRAQIVAAANRATGRQPDEIRLAAAAGSPWSRPEAVEQCAAPLHALGFVEAGTYTVDVLPVIIRFLLHKAERMYAAIYEHPKSGIWMNLIVLYEDGTSITFTTTRDRGLEKRPGHPVVYVTGAGADQLYATALRQIPPGPRKPLSPESIVTEFEKAWADGARWRKTRGVSLMETVSVIMSAGGRDARALRPDRIQFVGEQKGAPENELKASLARVFDLHQSVEKAYLSQVKYDEAPDTNVAICMVSATPRDVQLVEAIRKTFASLFRKGEHLDLLFVIPADVSRIERVCTPFYVRTRRPQ